MLMAVMAYAQETGGSDSGGAMMDTGGAMMGTGGAMMGESGGAMMDNMMMVTDGTYEVQLSGSQEVPPVTTDATGSATFTLSGDTLSLTGDFSGLSSPYTASHVHMAAMGENGDVIFPLNVTLDADNMSGIFSADQTLTQEQVDAAMAGNLYINVHSEMNPSGEIRAQLVPDMMGMMGETGGSMRPAVGDSGGAMMGDSGGAMMGDTGGAMMDNNMMSMTFADVDTNGDGSIDQMEFDTAMGMGMMGGDSGGAMMGETGGMMGMTFADYDTDGNGSLSEAEFNAMMAPQ